MIVGRTKIPGLTETTPYSQNDSKLDVMESIALRRQNKLDCIKQSIKHRLKKINSRGSTISPAFEEDFLQELIEEIEDE